VEALDESTNQESPASPSSGHAPNAAEVLYQEGWRAMRAGDFEQAASAFGRVMDDPRATLATDAAYWRAVSLGRGHRSDDALAALHAYVTRHAGSGHVDEARVMLGWLLLERGDRSGAREAFEAAAHSSVPRVRAAAARGLSQSTSSGDDGSP